MKTHRLFTALLAALTVALLAGSALAANLVKNGSFENDSNGDGLPNSWNQIGLTSMDKRVCNQSYAGACSFRLVADGSGKTFFQNVSQNGVAFDGCTLSLWFKSKEISSTSWNYEMIFYHTDGSTNTTAVPLPGGTSPWTFSDRTWNSFEDFMAVEVRVNFGPASGKAWIDKVKLDCP